MNELDLTVRRSALRMWLLAVLGVPFIIYGVDLLIERRLATTITDLIYPSENVTPPPFETHDLAWAWVFLVVGSVLTVWGTQRAHRAPPGRARGLAWSGLGCRRAICVICAAAVAGRRRFLRCGRCGWGGQIPRASNARVRAGDAPQVSLGCSLG